MADNTTSVTPVSNDIHLTGDDIKKQIVDNLIELRKDEAEAEVLKMCNNNSIKGENKENILKFYRAEKKEHDKRVKEEDNHKEESDLLKTFQAIITATDQKGIYEQLKEHILEFWLDTREDEALAFIKEICNVLEVDNEYKHLLKKFYKAEKAAADEAKKQEEKQARLETGLPEPLDMDSVSGRNEAFHRIANEYITHHKVAYVAGTLRKYTDGIYPASNENVSFVKSEIMRLALEKFDTPLSENHVTAVLKVIEMQKIVKLEDCEPDTDKVILANNKIINLETFEAYDFSPDKVYFSKIPTDYVPDAQEPEYFKKYLDTTFKGDDVSRMQIQELVGYLLCRNYKYQHIFYLLGDGGEGKGVLLKIIGFLLGTENLESFSLQQLTDHPQIMYHIAELHGKFANICGDIGTKRVENTEHIKKLSSGTDLVTGRRVRERPFNFISFAKLIFLLNKLPKKDAFTTGDKRRDVIIHFKNKIIDTDGEIKDLANVIKTSGEMPGILNWALEGLKRLEAQGGFTGIKSIAERGKEYELKSQPMKYFVDDCVVDAPGKFLLNARIYERYTEYRKLHGMPELSQEEIKNGIIYHCNKLGWNVSEKKPSIKGVRARAMSNIAFIEDVENDTLLDYESSVKDLIAFAKDEYHLIVENIGDFVDDYLKKNPGIFLPTKETFVNLAIILKSRGWKY